MKVRFDQKEKLEPSSSNIVRFKLKKGANKIRILDAEAEMFYQHYMENFPNNKYIICSKMEHGRCPICAMGNVPAQKFMFNVLDLDEKKVKLWTVSKKAMKVLMDLEEQVGKINSYDISANCDNLKYQNISSIIPLRDSKIKMTMVDKFSSNPNRYKTESLVKSRSIEDIEKLVGQATSPAEQVYDESLTNEDDDDLQKFLEDNNDEKAEKKSEKVKEEPKVVKEEPKEPKKEEKKTETSNDSNISEQDIDDFFDKE